MHLCLGVKTLQSAVSVICQITYLVSNSNLHDPTTSPQAKALFGLNIAVSMTSVIMGMVMLLLKGSLLTSVINKNPENTETEIEMSNDIVYTDNPLQKVDKDQSASNVVETHNRVYELEMENADLKIENTEQKTEITDLSTKNTLLENRVKELESKYENKADEKSADL